MTTYQFRHFLVDGITDYSNPLAINVGANRTVTAVYEALAPPTGVVQGTVYNANTNAPIGGATVTLGQYTATTNGSGFFNFPAVVAGTYSMTVNATGFQSATIPVVTVAQGQTTTQNVFLTPQVVQPKATIAGVIYGLDAQGNVNPVAGATVTLNGYVATTSATGTYQFTDVTAKAYTLTVSATGYPTKTASIDASAGGNYTQNVTLTTTPPPDGGFPFWIIAIPVAVVGVGAVGYYARGSKRKKR